MRPRRCVWDSTMRSRARQGSVSLRHQSRYVHREPLKQDHPRPHSLLQQDHGCPGWHTGHAPRSRGRCGQKRCQTVGCLDGTQTCFPSHGGRSAAQENVSSGLRLRTASRWARGSWILIGNPAATSLGPSGTVGEADASMARRQPPDALAWHEAWFETVPPAAITAGCRRGGACASPSRPSTAMSRWTC